MMSIGRIESWDDVAPWLQRIEMFPEQQLRSIADENEIPCEWNGERDELQPLDRLLERRGVVRQLVEDFRTSSRNPFPNWTTARPSPCSIEASLAKSLARREPILV